MPSSVLYNAVLHIDESDLFSGHRGLWYRIQQEHIGQWHKRVSKKRKGKMGLKRASFQKFAYDFGKHLNDIFLELI